MEPLRHMQLSIVRSTGTSYLSELDYSIEEVWRSIVCVRACVFVCVCVCVEGSIYGHVCAYTIVYVCGHVVRD